MNPVRNETETRDMKKLLENKVITGGQVPRANQGVSYF